MTRPKAHCRRQHGFTLIELMIVVAIVGILASIAYPSYRNSVLKGRRAQARVAIQEVLQQQERYMTQNNKYSPIDSSSTIFKNFSGDNKNTAAYAITADLCPATTTGGTALTFRDCVQVIATPLQPDPAAGSIRMTSTGVRDCTVTPAPASPPSTVCWP